MAHTPRSDDRAFMLKAEIYVVDCLRLFGQEPSEAQIKEVAKKLTAAMQKIMTPDPLHFCVTCGQPVDPGSEEVAAEMLAALKDGLSLAGGWREAIVELEDWCHERVRLKNMLATADQLDRWVEAARAAIAKAERG